MLLDARSLSGGAALTADVCIVGGGPAGISLALDLEQRTNATIIVLEGGGLTTEAASGALNDGENVGYPLYGAMRAPHTLGDVRVRALGGGTNLWAGDCTPLNAAELGPQPLQPVASWPFTAAELDPFYRAAHEKILLGPYDYDPVSWANRLGTPPPLATEPELETNIFQIMGTRFAGTYQPAMQASGRITLVHHANAISLDATAGGHHVTGVTARTLTGVQLSVQAEQFVLASGGIEVPRLLLASNAVTPAGIGNEHDLVGRYFADHLAFTWGFLLLRPSMAEAALYSTHSLATTTPDGIPTTIQVRAGFQVSGATAQAAGITGARIDAGLVDATSTTVQNIGVTMADIGELLRNAPGGAVRTAGVFRAYIEQIADHDSRVLLSPSLDPFGRPRARLDWRITPANWSNATKALEVIGSALAKHGLGRLQHAADWSTLANPPNTSQLLPNFIVAPNGNVPTGFAFETTFHHLCTTRMDVDPTLGVVDANCKVHSVDNLFIVGSSVFPVPVGQFPTITIVALALRLADHLATAVLS